jgi:GT2 family glycosyltransferase
MIELSVIVVTYNAKDITLKMLDSLKVSLKYFLEKSGVSSEVIVVDNSSTDGVLESIHEKYTKDGFVKIIDNNQNLGFAKANNLAVKNISNSSKFVLFLNPDIILEKDSILKTYEFYLSQENCGLVTCRILLPNGKIDIDCHRAFPTVWNAFCYFTKLEKTLGKIFPRIFGRYHMLWEDFSQTHEIDACLGAFMLIDRKTGDKVSWWSEDYFLNGEDLDLCYKIKKLNNKKIFFFPLATVVHHKGTKKISQKTAKVSDETKNLQIKSGIEAMKIFYKKFYAKKYPKILNNLVYLGMSILQKIRLLTKTE